MCSCDNKLIFFYFSIHQTLKGFELILKKCKIASPPPILKTSHHQKECKETVHRCACGGVCDEKSWRRNTPTLCRHAGLELSSNYSIYSTPPTTTKEKNTPKDQFLLDGVPISSRLFSLLTRQEWFQTETHAPPKPAVSTLAQVVTDCAKSADCRKRNGRFSKFWGAVLRTWVSQADGRLQLAAADETRDWPHRADVPVSALIHFPVLPEGRPFLRLLPVLLHSTTTTSSGPPPATLPLISTRMK